jgi:hypothetical protein
MIFLALLFLAWSVTTPTIPYIFDARCETPPNDLCPALVWLVFLHTFFGLAQFCKKPCNPVFNVLQSFKNNWTINKIICCSSMPMLWAIELSSRPGYLPQDFPCRKHNTNHWHIIKLWGRQYFSYVLQTQSRKVQKF